MAPTFKEFILKTLKVNMPERDFDLFMQGTQGLNKDSIDKSAMIAIFDKPFKEALIRFEKRKQLMGVVSYDYSQSPNISAIQ